MEQALLKAIESAPEATAIVLVVYLFIKAQQFNTKTYINAFKEMHDEHIAARQRGHDMSDKVAATNIQLAVVLTELKTGVAELSRKIKSNGNNH